MKTEDSALPWWPKGKGWPRQWWRPRPNAKPPSFEFNRAIVLVLMLLHLVSLGELSLKLLRIVLGMPFVMVAGDHDIHRDQSLFHALCKKFATLLNASIKI